MHRHSVDQCAGPVREILDVRWVAAARLDARTEERTLDRSSLRAQIALVPQRGVLFSGTILENMTLFREGRAIDDAIKLVGRLGMEETITRLPEGLDTQVGGGIASVLSEGFRQRIIMVRAMIGDQKILLFDDANAAFDHAHDEQLNVLLGEWFADARLGRDSLQYPDGS